ncbi:unnamed protein product, partial [Nesidiocoris tenuis]
MDRYKMIEAGSFPVQSSIDRIYFRVELLPRKPPQILEERTFIIIEQTPPK